MLDTWKRLKGLYPQGKPLLATKRPHITGFQSISADGTDMRPLIIVTILQKLKGLLDTMNSDLPSP
jgi:hypothetical protein